MMCATAAARPATPAAPSGRPPSQPHSFASPLWPESSRMRARSFSAFSGAQGIEEPAIHPSRESFTYE